jgi:hypothetical protein
MAERDADKQRTGDAELNLICPNARPRIDTSAMTMTALPTCSPLKKRLENHMFHLSAERCSVGNASSETALHSAIRRGAYRLTAEYDRVRPGRIRPGSNAV